MTGDRLGGRILSRLYCLGQTRPHVDCDFRFGNEGSKRRPLSHRQLVNRWRAVGGQLTQVSKVA